MLRSSQIWEAKSSIATRFMCCPTISALITVVIEGRDSIQLVEDSRLKLMDAHEQLHAMQHALPHQRESRGISLSPSLGTACERLSAPELTGT